ncbi:Uncharacterised protein [Bordetella pertussis]|nr:Uncharacterised protein [Bordetella pertussis]CFP64200.1 Uncharacterised protein [Bordetella pertussis]
MRANPAQSSGNWRVFLDNPSRPGRFIGRGAAPKLDVPPISHGDVPWLTIPSKAKSRLSPAAPRTSAA